jgi:DNA-binding Lrp family transcriptional regulator
VKDLDFQLARLIELHGLQGTKSIALEMGVSERTVHRHIDALIEQRIIKAVAVLNPVTWGFKGWSKIGIKIDPKYLIHVTRAMVNHPSVYFVAYSLGRFDIIIAVNFETIDRLLYFVNSELSMLKGVINYETWLLACPRKYYDFVWPAPASKGPDGRSEGNQNPGEISKPQIDSIDRQIIAILKEDGLAKPATIKARLGLGESTIRKHITHLVNNNSFRQEAIVSPNLMVNDTWATIGINTSGRDPHQIIDRVLNYPEVQQAAVSLGRFNVMLGAHFSHIDLLNRFVSVDLPLIEGISSTETFIHNKPLKFHDIPLVYDQDDGVSHSQ